MCSLIQIRGHCVIYGSCECASQSSPSFNFGMQWSVTFFCASLRFRSDALACLGMEVNGAKSTVWLPLKAAEASVRLRPLAKQALTSPSFPLLLLNFFFLFQWPPAPIAEVSMRLPLLAVQATQVLQDSLPVAYSYSRWSKHEAASANRSGYTSSSRLPSCGLQLQQMKQAWVGLLRYEIFTVW